MAGQIILTPVRNLPEFRLYHLPSLVFIVFASCTADQMRSPVATANPSAVADDTIAVADVKEFLNLRLQGQSEFTPIVLSSTGSSAIVARVAYVRGRRDIQVLERSGDKWSFVGDEGEALTCVNGNFLMDAIKGPDGRLWVMAGYSTPSNAQRGERNYLHCLEGGNWRIAGPEQGSPVGDMGDCGLHFIGNDEPAHHFQQFDAGARNRSREFLLQLRGDRWIEHPAQSLLRRTGGMFAWRQKDAWLLGRESHKRETIITGWLLNGPAQSDIHGPHRVLSLAGRFEITRAAAAEDGRIAILTEGRKGLFGTHLRSATVVKADQTGVHEVIEIPSPPREVEQLAWSPGGELMATSMEGTQTVSVYALRNGKWTRIAEASQPASAGHILLHRLFVQTDGTPIVTWMDFFPCFSI